MRTWSVEPGTDGRWYAVETRGAKRTVVQMSRNFDDVWETVNQMASIEDELAAEAAVERFFEEGPNGGTYTGSPEEALDRELAFWMEDAS